MEFLLIILLSILLSCQKEHTPKKPQQVPAAHLPAAIIGEWKKVSQPGREIITIFTTDSMHSYDNGHLRMSGTYQLRDEYLTFYKTGISEGVTFPISMRDDTLFLPMPHAFIKQGQ